MFIYFCTCSDWKCEIGCAGIFPLAEIPHPLAAELGVWGDSYSGLGYFFCGLSATPLVHLHPRQVDLEHDQDRCPSGTNLPFNFLPSLHDPFPHPIPRHPHSIITDRGGAVRNVYSSLCAQGRMPHYLQGWLEEEELGTAGGGTAGHSWWAAFWDIPSSSPVTPHFSPDVLPLLCFYFIEERMKLLKSFYFFLSSPSQTSLPLYQSWSTFGVYSLGSDHEKLWWKGLGWEIFSLLPMEKLWARPHRSCSRSNQRGIEMEGCWDGWIDGWMDAWRDR